MMGEIKSFKTATMQLVAQHDTYIDVNDQQKNFGRSDQLLADEW